MKQETMDSLYVEYILMYEDGQYIEVFLLFEQLAKKGHPNSQNMLGIMYEEGEGVQVSYEKARYWYSKAAKQGSAVAQKNLNELNNSTI